MAEQGPFFSQVLASTSLKGFLVADQTWCDYEVKEGFIQSCSEIQGK